MAIKQTKEDFIEKAVKIHSDKYDYSLVEYVNFRSKVKIICIKHNHTFEISPKDHTIHQRGCPKCGYERTKNSLTGTLEEFLKRSKKHHGDKYDYSLVDWKNASEKVKIICPTHGIFEQLPTTHQRGFGCFKCASILRGDKQRKPKKIKVIKKVHKYNTKIFIEKVNIIHNDKYNYSKTNYDGYYKNVTIICPNHGEYTQKAGDHLNGNGCPKCNRSKGEEIINIYLMNNRIKFKEQKRFIGLKDKSSLKFDFYLPDHNLCIEFDGEQHFRPVDYSRGRLSNEELLNQFKDIQRKDIMKNQYCLNNNINILRIPYINIDQIDNIIDNYLKLLTKDKK